MKTADEKAYKACLEEMRKNTIATIRFINSTAPELCTDPEFKELFEECRRINLESLAFARLNMAWRTDPDIFKHYPYSHHEERADK